MSSTTSISDLIVPPLGAPTSIFAPLEGQIVTGSDVMITLSELTSGIELCK
jgi:hypothetical protein